MEKNNKMPNFMSFPVFNPNNLEKLRYQTRNKPELLKEIIDSFLEESHELVGDINKYINENNIELLSRSVHTLKGLAGTIGASRFYQILSYVDACHKQNDFSIKSDLPDIFNKNLKLLHTYFKEEGF